METKLKKTDEEWAEELTPEQFEVLRKRGTERPFTGEYVYSKDSGTYRCGACDAKLFSSNAKFDSGTGWPSFTKPLEPANVKTKTDRKLFMARTEVRSAVADSHLGHVFDDGPPPTGLRYCMNGIAMTFRPAGTA